MDRRSVSDKPEPKIPRIPHMVCGGVSTPGFLSCGESERSDKPKTHTRKGGLRMRMAAVDNIPPGSPRSTKNIGERWMDEPTQCLTLLSLEEHPAPATASKSCQVLACVGETTHALKVRLPHKQQQIDSHAQRVEIA